MTTCARACFAMTCRRRGRFCVCKAVGRVGCVETCCVAAVQGSEGTGRDDTSPLSLRGAKRRGNPHPRRNTGQVGCGLGKFVDGWEFALGTASRFVLLRGRGLPRQCAHWLAMTCKRQMCGYVCKDAMTGRRQGRFCVCRGIRPHVHNPPGGTGRTASCGANCRAKGACCQLGSRPDALTGDLGIPPLRIPPRGIYRWSTRSRISWVRPWFQYWVPM